jgi:hypothetical protein
MAKNLGCNYDLMKQGRAGSEQEIVAIMRSSLDRTTSGTHTLAGGGAVCMIQSVCHQSFVDEQ